MKIGIVTFHRAHNCGAALQCAALVSVLRRMGHDVEVVDNNSIGETHWPDFGKITSLLGLCGWILRFFMSVDVAYKYFRNYRLFYKRQIPMSSKCFGSVPKDRYDRIIVGSDQVFNPKITKSQAGAFLLENFGDEVVKCCYAASFGTPSLSAEYRSRFKVALSKFALLGFRETSATRICRDELGLNLEMQTVLDPTLLLAAEDYEKFECPVRVSGKYVAIYCDYICQREARLVADRIARRHGLQVVYIDQYRLSRFKMTKGDCIGVAPQEFLWLIRNAEYVITTSFHGTAFSLINCKRFVVIRPHGHPMNERVVDLLNRLGIPQQVVFSNCIPGNEHLEEMFSVDYMSVKVRLSVLQKESLDFLKAISSCVASRATK